MNESNPSDAALAELLTLTMEVDEYGDTRYRNHLGQFHRIHGPAVIYSDGCEDWFQNGLLHREDGPAVIVNDGRKYWYFNNEFLTEQEWNERIQSL